MVWNTTQSSLYKAVNDYNQTVEHKECSPEHITACDNTYGFKKQNNTACGEFNNSSIPHSSNQQAKQCCNNKNTFTVKNLFADKDFLLILGLILILSKEGADSKLILALTIVLLG